MAMLAGRDDDRWRLLLLDVVLAPPSVDVVVVDAAFVDDTGLIVSSTAALFDERIRRPISGCGKTGDGDIFGGYGIWACGVVLVRTASSATVDCGCELLHIVERVTLVLRWLRYTRFSIKKRL